MENKIKNNEYIIDKVISNYNSQSEVHKQHINIAIILMLTMFIIGMIYNYGEKIGVFIYNILN